MASNEMPHSLRASVRGGGPWRPATCYHGGRARNRPLFDSAAKAEAFLASTGFGSDLEPVEVSSAGLIRALESVGDRVEYVALNPPPAKEGGMKVRMGSLRELVGTLETSRQEDDLFGLSSDGG